MTNQNKNKLTYFNKKTLFHFLASTLVTLFLFISFEARADWLWRKKETCENMVDNMIESGLDGLKEENLNHVKHGCYAIILKTGDHKELYSYYRSYKYIDDLNKGKGANNIYHYMLLYANQNSRDFDQKTQSFKKEQGLYEKELKEFEDNMTQEEKAKAFSYIADNLATGKEGWVKIHDYYKSFEYLKRAAEAGDRFSQVELGTCYFFGADRFFKFNFSKSYIEAYKWTYISTKHSETNSYEHGIALKNLKKIRLGMINAQIIEAKQEANLWLKNNKEFINKNPLRVLQMSKEEIEKATQESKEIIKNYNMLPSNLPTNK